MWFDSCKKISLLLTLLIVVVGVQAATLPTVDITNNAATINGVNKLDNFNVRISGVDYNFVYKDFNFVSKLYTFTLVNVQRLVNNGNYAFWNINGRTITVRPTYVDSSGKVNLVISQPESTSVQCTDNFDNDLDGFMDCADSGCNGVVKAAGGVCQYSLEITCNDNFDNDGDGLVDCADNDCSNDDSCQAEQTCFDTDGGSNTGTKGTTSGYNPQGVYDEVTDYCYSDSNVAENYCTGDVRYSSVRFCQYGCFEGACRSAPVVVDTDNDSVADANDNCPLLSNSGQEDLDSDGEGDACDGDIDGDGISNRNELNNPAVGYGETANVDVDNDGLTNDYDLDSDNDGFSDYVESANSNPYNPSSIPNDYDGDGVADSVDNCFSTANPDQLNTDGDTQGNACDKDDDNDGVADTNDNCPLVVNSDQVDSNADGQGDACTNNDFDGDGIDNNIDICSETPLGAPVYNNGCMVGDLDHNGCFNSNLASGSELISISNILSHSFNQCANLPPQASFVDLNNDGCVNIFDLPLLAKYLNLEKENYACE